MLLPELNIYGISPKSWTVESFFIHVNKHNEHHKVTIIWWHSQCGSTNAAIWGKLGWPHRFLSVRHTPKCSMCGISLLQATAVKRRQAVMQQWNVLLHMWDFWRWATSTRLQLAKSCSFWFGNSCLLLYMTALHEVVDTLEASQLGGAGGGGGTQQQNQLDFLVQANVASYRVT